MTFEQVLLLALFLLAPLLSAATRWLQRQTAEDEGRREEAARLERRPGPAPREKPRRPSPAEEPVAARPPAAAVPSRPTLPGLRSRRALRNSIVIAAVLGPCRATDPY